MPDEVGTGVTVAPADRPTQAYYRRLQCGSTPHPHIRTPAPPAQPLFQSSICRRFNFGTEMRDSLKNTRKAT